MEELIKQAFLHVDVIEPHVHAGHYDLIGPNGEIILPGVWDQVIEPDWAITMHMWPIEQPRPDNPRFDRPLAPTKKHPRAGEPNLGEVTPAPVPSQTNGSQDLAGVVG